MAAGKFKKAFFAYPATPPEVASTIRSACDRIKVSISEASVVPWPQMEIFGDNIADQVRKNVSEADVLVCDVTKPNLNVWYEIGFAIGRGKTIAPVLNVSIAEAKKSAVSDGIFDTIGFREYENSDQLVEIFRSLPNTNLVDLYGKPPNSAQPLFILDTFRKTDFRNVMVSAIKDSKVFYRSFDPVELPRFASIAAISDVSSSAGVLIPFLPSGIDDAPRHNLRAAFLAGLSHGLEKQTLIVSPAQNGNAEPIDFRDFVSVIYDQDDLVSKVSAFSMATLLATQNARVERKTPRTRLQILTLGASAAENEFRTLETYFVETSEFVRTLRGEIGVVAGRKGSGKTAIFFMVRDTVRPNRNAFVTDLKPESHQLTLFRQELLKLIDVGVFDHTLAAFWYFVFLSEILFTIRRELNHRARAGGADYEAVLEIDQTLSDFEILDSGDFTARINRLSKYVVEEMNLLQKKGGNLTAERLTNIVFRGGITQIKNLIVKHTNSKSTLLLLFDNIDKGWPTNGVDKFDARMVRLMIETLDKIRRDFDATNREFASVVFLRNDIYELLVEDTPDRGKAGEIRIDWNDRAKLRQVIFRRLQSATKRESATFDNIWNDLFVGSVGGQNSFEYCVDHCLMRPRFLITIIDNAISNAINRGHTTVMENDLIDAVKQHSNYLISDFGYEIRDSSGLSADILYSLVGISNELGRTEILERFKAFDIPDDQLNEAFRLMLWYGVVGLIVAGGPAKYIYDFDYSLKRLDAEIRLSKNEPVYTVNPAFHVALSQ